MTLLTTHHLLCLVKHLIIIEDGVECRLLTHLTHIHIIERRIRRLRRPVFRQILQPPTIPLLQLHLRHILQYLPLLTLLNEVNVLERILRHQLLPYVPQLENALTIVDE